MKQQYILDVWSKESLNESRDVLAIYTYALECFHIEKEMCMDYVLNDLCSSSIDNYLKYLQFLTGTIQVLVPRPVFVDANSVEWDISLEDVQIIMEHNHIYHPETKELVEDVEDRVFMACAPHPNIAKEWKHPKYT